MIGRRRGIVIAASLGRASCNVGDVDAAIPQEDDDVLDPETEKAPKPVQAVKEIDYSKKTKKELNELINDALEAGDYATVDKLRHFL